MHRFAARRHGATTAGGRGPPRVLPPKKSDARLSGDRLLRLKVPTCRRATVGPDAVE